VVKNEKKYVLCLKLFDAIKNKENGGEESDSLGYLNHSFSKESHLKSLVPLKVFRNGTVVDVANKAKQRVMIVPCVE